MAEVHHFAYGLFNPIAAYLMAFVGSLIGLVCTARARQAGPGGRRVRWLIIASISIGGAGIWLMHFTAMLGFDVPDSAVRYNVPVTAISLVMAVLTVGVGLFIAGHGRPSAIRVIAGGVFAGSGVVAMHYLGMAAMHVSGTIRYDPGLVGASVTIAIVAATVALWFTVTVKGWASIIAAAAVMGVAVCGMHYTGMAAMRVTLDPNAGPVEGLSPFLLIVPITLLTAAALVGTAISGLQAMTEEEFGAGPLKPLRVRPARPAAPAGSPEGSLGPWTLRAVAVDLKVPSVTVPKQRVPSPRPHHRPAKQ